MDISSEPLRDDENRFVDEIAALLAPWGFAPSVGRVYAYLLLRQTRVSVDEIAAALGISRAGAWSAARFLENFEHVRRFGSVGSKRALYAISDNYASPMREQTKLLGELGRLLQACAADTAAPEAAAPLAERARFLLALREAMNTAIDAVNERTREAV
jgi:HTH-type transcriptional regulator, osmoprotectant uptake regulator